MDTNSNNFEQLRDRKTEHLQICLDFAKEVIEDTESAGFDKIKLVHSALPELSFNDIDTSVRFLGSTIPIPVFISCMTGGSAQRFQMNEQLAVAAQKTGIPVGMGSIRLLFEHDEIFPHFHMKPFAPDVPVLANIGSVQIKTIAHKKIIEMLKRLEVQALVIHCNPGQELVQPEGDYNFKGLFSSISKFCENSPIPVIVKETGCGIRPSLVIRLLNNGVSYVDLAGSGGTNWILVEGQRTEEDDMLITKEFDSWGLPTALLQAVVGRHDGKIIASGGIRKGTDIAKAIALGAGVTGMALPFIRALDKQGIEGVLKLTYRLQKSLKIAMTLAGAIDLKTLSQTPVLFDPDFISLMNQLKQIEDIEPE